MPIAARILRVLALPSFALLATATVAVAAPTVAPSTGGQLPDGVSSLLTALQTKQSIYIPCYAFTPLAPGPREDWNPGRESCFLLKQNSQLVLAAPVHIPATNGKLRIKKLRCYAKSGTAGDRIEYSAKLWGNGTSLAKLDVVQKPEEPAESAASPTPGIDLDPLTQHYDLSLSWKVVVPNGDGWLPKDNEFRGCRVDYSVMNL